MVRFLYLSFVVIVLCCMILFSEGVIFTDFANSVNEVDAFMEMNRKNVVENDRFVVSWLLGSEGEDGVVNSSDYLTYNQAFDLLERLKIELGASECNIPQIRYKVDVKIDKASFAFYLDLLFSDVPLLSENIYISDVPAADDKHKYISRLVNSGIMPLDDEYLFFPDEYVTIDYVRDVVTNIRNDEERNVSERVLTAKSKVIEFDAVLQNPELPTGCEITSLTSALNFYGFDVDKCFLADNYLIKGEIGMASPYDAFVGTPYEYSSYGCYSPVIEKTANTFLEEQDSNLRVYNFSGCEIDDLLIEIEKGNPVIAWTTMYMLNSYVSVRWKVYGKVSEWLANSHCVVVHGYDLDRNILYVADPLVGNVEYNLGLFRNRYNQIKKQAIVIK